MAAGYRRFRRRAAAALVLQHGGGSFTGPIWARPGLTGPGVLLLPRPVGNRLRWWRIVPSVWLQRCCPNATWPRVSRRGLCARSSSSFRRPRCVLLLVPLFEFADAGAAALEGGLRGRLYGERRGGGDGLSLAVWTARSGRRGTLVLAELRQRQPQIASWRLGLKSFGGLGYRAWCVRFFRAKALRFSANDGDVCGCRYPLGGVSLWVPYLR